MPMPAAITRTQLKKNASPIPAVGPINATLMFSIVSSSTLPLVTFSRSSA